MAGCQSEILTLIDVSFFSDFLEIQSSLEVVIRIRLYP